MQTTKIALILFAFFLTGNLAPISIRAETFMDFDALPPTPADQSPGDGGGWLYTTAQANPDPAYVMTAQDWAGWRNTRAYPAPNDAIHDLFYTYINSYNSDHMGYATYGYLEVVSHTAILGRALRHRTTGAHNGTQPIGEIVATKQHYLDFLANGTNPTATGQALGHPCLYFANTSPQGGFLPFPAAKGANRLSFYYYAPASLTNGEGGWGKRPEITMNVGPYNGVGGHWYHEICTQGGGWTHAIIDGHPQHNNSWSSADLYPYPSSSLRDMGESYFNNWYRWYVTFKPYAGYAEIPFDTYFDDFVFHNDPEPQNNETINSPAVTWFPDSRHFEIGFMDKYKNNANSFSTYELRYSFQPITNAEWGQATPARILADARFAIDARDDGRFAKHWPHYASVWAPFTLEADDLQQLVPGMVVHFALKDISQLNGNSMLPVTDTGVGRWSTGGRDYVTHGDSFDYAGDAPALLLIKRIDFRIPADPTAGTGSLRVEIDPPGAIGTLWRRLGDPTWRAPGETDNAAPAGMVEVEVQAPTGWRAPDNTLTAVAHGQASVLRLRCRPAGLPGRDLLLEP